MRYVYAVTAALLAGGATATMVFQQPVGAQVAQNAPGAIQGAQAPAGAPSTFAELAARLQPAVVNISTTQSVQIQPNNPFAGTPFGEFFGQFGPDRPVTQRATSLGSGFIISPDGYVVTNNHVISGGRGPGATAVVDSITVTLPDRKEYKARVVGRDAASDLALLKIDARNLPYVEFGDSKRTRVGDWVLAIGNPFGLGGTVTAGIVSALHRNIGLGGAYDRYIQTDASINQGNSGGPMFDVNGNVIGINTAIFSPTGGNVGIGFAIPAEEAKPVIDALKAGGTVRRGYLGVAIQPMTEDMAAAIGLPKNRGEIVARVEPGQAAARAGIRQGDVIVSINETEITPDSTLSYIVANLPIGSRVPVELIRDGKRLRLVAVVGERPAEEQLAEAEDFGEESQGSSADNQRASATALGLGLTELTPRLASQLGVSAETKGLVVAAVDPSSDAGAKGLRRGDIILSINQRPTPTPDAASAIVSEARKSGRTSVLLLVQRGNTPPRYVGIELKRQ